MNKKTIEEGQKILKQLTLVDTILEILEVNDGTKTFDDDIALIKIKLSANYNHANVDSNDSIYHTIARSIVVICTMEKKMLELELKALK